MRTLKLLLPLIRSLIIIIIVAFILSLIFPGCSKQSIQENRYVFDKYEMIIDWYDLDTALQKRTVWWQHDSIWKTETKMMLDTITDKWYLMCATYVNPLHIEHWYYTRNGNKIHPSIYPKN